jgi:hypothetical protein
MCGEKDVSICECVSVNVYYVEGETQRGRQVCGSDFFTLSQTVTVTEYSRPRKLTRVIQS